MLQVISIFLVASIISFLGSLQLGPVNFTVINTCISNGKKSAFYIAIGGVLPEFIYCGLAIYSASYVNTNSPYVLWLTIGFICLLLILVIIFWFKKNKPTHYLTKAENKPTPLISVLKGFSLAILNPQLLPFWGFIFISFNSISFLKIDNVASKLAFVCGAGFGAFVLLLSIIMLVNKFKIRLETYLNHPYYYKMLSVIFLLVALHQVYLLLR